MGAVVEQWDEDTSARDEAVRRLVAAGRARPTGERGRFGGFAVAAAAAVALVAGFLLTPRLHAHPTPSADRPGNAVADHTAADLAAAIAKARGQLIRTPGDWATWADLGSAYVQEAGITADPTWYPRAQDAFNHSMQVRPEGNAPALTGLGTLATARHDFTGALRYGQSAVAADGYSAAAQGVMADALIELGRYYEAWTAIQQMVDLVPDTSSLARQSYSWELRGDMTQARALMRQALTAAATPADTAFALLRLAELSWDTGDLNTAKSYVDDGLRRLPDNPRLIAERAKLAADWGNAGAAIADYQQVVARLPLPQYAIEFGDLLSTTGDKAGAARQYAVAQTEMKKYASQGVDLDLELAAFQADHGTSAAALTSASSGYPKRPSIIGADTMAWALHQAKQDNKALPYAKQAMALGGHNALYQFHLGMIEMSLGQRTSARADLAAALRTNPYFSLFQVATARAALAALRDAP